MAASGRDDADGAPNVDADLVRALLAEQHPDLAALDVAPLASGWDNAVFRVGPDLVARLPRRPEGVALIAHEQRWLPELAARLPLPVPAPVRTGAPGSGYPWPWSLCPWFPGEPASTHPPADAHRTARALGGFLAALHTSAPGDAPANPYRGIPLADRADRFHDALASVRSGARALSPDVARWAVERWEALASSPPWDGPPLWLHGDLHPQNLLVNEGRLAAVIDFGDLTAGDPATDLSVGWMLFDAADRSELRTASGHLDDHTWARAEGWALALAVSYLEGSPEGSPMVDVAGRTLAALRAG